LSLLILGNIGHYYKCLTTSSFHFFPHHNLPNFRLLNSHANVQVYGQFSFILDEIQWLKLHIKVSIHNVFEIRKYDSLNIEEVLIMILLDSMYGMVVLKMGFKFWNHIRVFCQLLWISESRRRGSNIQTINYLFGNYFKAQFWGSKNGTKIERCCSLANWRVNKI
jgi:hypothetical protein